ncbi:MAG: ribonuclease P protein component [Hyphomicrobiales bacterium]
MGAKMEKSGSNLSPGLANSVVHHDRRRAMQRADFKAVSKGRRYTSGMMTLQADVRSNPMGGPRFGFVLSRKVGNAVERNRIRRRLRAAICETKAVAGSEPNDFVIVGRRALLTASFDRILSELSQGLSRVRPRPSSPISSQKDRH